MADNDGTLIGQVFIFLVTILGFAIQIYREKRNRAWDLVDRELAREAIAAKVDVATTATIRRQEHVIQKIEENNDINREAIKVSNTFNEKLISLAERINGPYERKASGIHQLAELQQTLRETKEAVNETKHTAEDTLVTVQKIDEKL